MKNNEEKFEFNIDVPQLISEIFENNPGMDIFKIPFTVLQSKLRKLAKRAIELNDPELNILMLEMKLYDVEKHSEIRPLIEEQRKLIKG